MKNIKVIMSENSVSFPNGYCLGSVGEHNASMLEITLPESMITDIDYHTINIGGIETAIIRSSENIDGAFRKNDTIYQPLTSTYTQNKIVDITVTAYKQKEEIPEVVNISPTVHGLYFLEGIGKSTPGGIVAEVYLLHQNMEKLKPLSEIDATVIKELTDENGELCYKGKPVASGSGSGGLSREEVEQVVHDWYESFGRGYIEDYAASKGDFEELDGAVSELSQNVEILTETIGAINELVQAI